MNNADKPAYPTEEWRDISEYSGLYQISNYGRVRALEKTITYIRPKRVEVRPGRIMKTMAHRRNGYVYVNLTDKGVQKGHRVHRLVAKAFIDNPYNLPEVNHEDFNKENNHVSNLKWCDRYYQNQHASKKIGRKWQRHRLGKCGGDNPKSKPVLVIDLTDKVIAKYASQNLAAKATSSDQSKISACCVGKRKTHNGLKFQYA